VKLICFLIEHQRPRAMQLSHEARIGERLGVTIHLWLTDRDPHRLTVVCQQADGSEYVLGSFEGQCALGTKLLALGGWLEPLREAGWVKLKLLCDGERLEVSRNLFILGPRRARAPRGPYLGRGTAREQPHDADGTADPQPLPLAAPLRASRRR
jgi:hypothetical protein